jgi:hypothetical protein
MMNKTRVAMVLGGLLLGAGAGSASASIASPEFRTAVPVTIHLARHGDGRDDGRDRGRDDVGCDDHGTDLCAARNGDQFARHDGDNGRGRGRGRDDAGCDDHGTDLCAASDRSRES